MSRPRFGYERIHVLLRREGWHVNLKRVHRLYCLEGLQVRMRVRRKKRMSLHRGPAPAPTGPGQRWSMDLVHDQLVNGQPFRVLTVIDNWSRESPVLEVGFRLTGNSVVETLSRVGKMCVSQHASPWTVAPNLLPGHWTAGLGRTRCSLTSRALKANGQWALRVIQWQAAPRMSECSRIRIPGAGKAYYRSVATRL
jgi:hypothetical protein